MYAVADAEPGLDRRTRVARITELTGFGSRVGGEAVAIRPDGSVAAGALLAGRADAAVATAVGEAGILEVRVTDPEAEASGLACGGRAEVLFQQIDSIPAAAWEALRARRPVVIATELTTGATRIVLDDGGTHGSTGGHDAEVDSVALARLRGGRAGAEVVHECLVEAFLPPTRLTIVGRAGVGDALEAQAALLGWIAATVESADDGVAAAGALASQDALVVLSHDATVDTPVLAEALRRGRGFVGALGSRHTQAARRERLSRQGFAQADLERIHGPVGLDLGSRTPAETAVAIVAEIIAHRSGRDATPLQAGAGPING